MQLWEGTIIGEILYFALIAPMVLLAMWGTSKISNFKVGDSAYLRACAICGLPFVVLNVYSALSAPMLALLVLIAAPLTILGAKKFFELTWNELGVACGFGAIGFFIACFAIANIQGIIVSSDSKVATVRRNGFDIAAFARQFEGGSGDNNASPVHAGSRSRLAGQGTSSSTADDALARFKDLVFSKTNVDLSLATIEQCTPDVIELKRQLNSLRPSCQGDPEWPNLTQQVEAFAQKVNALPSGKLDPALMVDSPDAEDWTTGTLSRGKMGPEVSFQLFKIRPPLDMKLDPGSSENSPTGLVWTGITEPTAKFSIYTTPRTNKKQRKPMVSDKPAVLRAANEAGFFTINGANLTIQSGQISGIPFTRLAANADVEGEHWIEFIAPADDRWLIIHLVPPPKNPQFSKIMEAAAKTVRIGD